MRASQRIKDIVRALSLANLCFILAWTELLGPGRSLWPEMPRKYSFNAFLSVALCVLLLAMFLFSAISLARRSRRSWALKVARLVFPLMLLIPLNGFFRMLLPDQVSILQLVILVVAVAMIAVSDVRPWDRIMIRSAAAVVLVLSPFVLITFGQAAWSMTSFSSKPLAGPLPVKHSAPRVLWLLFDEMDQQITFADRPSRLRLPELDRLRGQAVYATNAYPPADETLMSMPALITGRLVTEVRPAGPSELEITFADSKGNSKLSREPNLFSRARQAGVNTAIIGNYIPYCRILENSLTRCSHHDIAAVTFRQAMFNEGVTLIDSIPLAPTLASFFRVFNDSKAWERDERQKQADAFTGILEDTKGMAVDSSLGLILVHWPVPHPPNIYDGHKESLELTGESSYLDNLQLCDRALGELRLVLENSGLWDKTIILVTSDHWWRTDIWRPTIFWSSEDEETMPHQTDHRIPFLLKLAGQKQTVQYESGFNSILTHDLLLALLKGEVSQPASVVDWLNLHRSLAESPYHFRSASTK